MKLKRVTLSARHRIRPQVKDYLADPSKFASAAPAAAAAGGAPAAKKEEPKKEEPSEEEDMGFSLFD